MRIVERGKLKQNLSYKRCEHCESVLEIGEWDWTLEQYISKPRFHVRCLVCHKKVYRD